MRHTRIHCICVFAYWADAYYAYILVRIYLSCTVLQAFSNMAMLVTIYTYSVVLVSEYLQCAVVDKMAAAHFHLPEEQ